MNPTRRKLLRKLHHKSQTLLDGVFDDEQIREIQEAQDDDAFELVDLDVETDYACPSCGYEWSGQPKPSRSDEKKETA